MEAQEYVESIINGILDDSMTIAQGKSNAFELFSGSVINQKQFDEIMTCIREVQTVQQDMANSEDGDGYWNYDSSPYDWDEFRENYLEALREGGNPYAFAEFSSEDYDERDDDYEMFSIGEVKYEVDTTPVLDLSVSATNRLPHNQD
ncbi:MAG: hypothetical protein CL489_10230 [Acidobacteria bacterium]|nr:hypothetical protein [Acidobacteriota bacterium]|tara:strand:+ start:4234 stop:4674 length:441 start_codon:yes stop_codon:yes gene_type:complete